MSEPQQFHHILVINDYKGRRIISLENSNYTLGRDSQNDIVIYDYQVSRVHATLIKKEDREREIFSYRIIDGDLTGKKSTNGLTINGNTCTSHELKHSDIIQFSCDTKANYYIVDTHVELDLFNPDDLSKINLSRTSINDRTHKTISRKSAQKNQLDSQNQQELIRLASFPELSPNPIVEIDLAGNITYLNPAASIKFENIYEQKLTHPILAGLLSEEKNKQGNLSLREVRIGSEVFEQYIHYLSEKKLIRSYIFNSTKRKDIETSLRESDALYQAVIRQTSEGVFLVNTSNKKILEANNAYTKLLGYTEEEIVQLTLDDIIENDINKFNRDLKKVLKDRQDHVAEYLHRCRDGSLINIESSISIITYQSQDIFCFVVRNIRKINPRENNSNYQILYDLLTQLPKQKLFKEHLNIAIANAKRHQYLIAVIILEIEDLEQLKKAEQRESYEYLLKNFAQLFQSCLRSGDLAACWDDDKFIALVSHLRNLRDLAKIGKRMSEILQKYLDSQPEQVKLKLNMGMVIYPVDGDNSSSLIDHALASLEQSKKRNHPQYGITGFIITPKTVNLLKLESLITNAIKEQQFFLCYQPQVNIKTGKITGIEALLRWEHPKLGQIDPTDFLQTAEETDVMLLLSRWVLQTACAQNKAWQDAGLPSLPIGINLSPRQFQQSNLVEMVDKVLKQTGLTAADLELEIIENCLHQNYEFAAQTMRELVQMGVRICIDDFGIGNSCFGYLEQLPFHTVKIGQDLIVKFNNEPKHNAMISAVVTLAKAFNVRVLAEGVEKLAQIDLLLSLECEQIQGNLFSRPLTNQDATNFLKRGDYTIVPYT